ncbi:Hypothetical protein SMB2099_1483 [Serratia marcescens SMB2099]|nr:Hypothetical protein SMB2099_1483 [Serratia marcescens SMB2099]
MSVFAIKRKARQTFNGQQLSRFREHWLKNIINAVIFLSERTAHFPILGLIFNLLILND